MEFILLNEIKPLCILDSWTDKTRHPAMKSLARMFYNCGTVYRRPNWWCKTSLVVAPLASPPARMYLDVYLTKAELWEAGFSFITHIHTVHRWAAPLEQLSGKCVAQGQISGGNEGGRSAAVSPSPPRSLLLVWGTSQPLWMDWTNLYKETQSAQKQKMLKIMNSHQIIKGPITAIKRNPQNSPELCFEMIASSSPLRLPSDS